MAGKAAKRPYRRYSLEERSAAVAAAGSQGISGASKALGIPKATVWGWVHQAGKEQASAGHVAPVQSGSPSAGEAGTAGQTLAASGREAVRRSAARRYTPSEKAEILEYASAHSVSEAAKEYGVSRFSIQDWRRKVRRAAEGKGDSPTSGPSPQDVEAQRDQEILGLWHKRLWHGGGLGPSQIRNQLRRQGVKVAVHTVRRVMEDAGYRPPKTRSRAHDERFEATRPNHIWHLDFVQRYVNRASTFTLILLDDYSRFVVGHGVGDAERADLVVRGGSVTERRSPSPSGASASPSTSSSSSIPPVEPSRARRSAPPKTASRSSRP